MSSDSYSFLDVAVLDAVRQRFAAGDALVILSGDRDQVIWANGPGATLFGYPDIETIIGASAGLPAVAKRQIMATSGFPDIGSNRALLLRLATGVSSQAVAFRASAITMPDDEKTILLAAQASEAGATTPAEIAARAIGGFTESGHFIAFIDGEGGVEAASEGFSSLSIGQPTLAALVADVAAERGRVVKRLVPGAAVSYPAGFARLTDEPARHLLVVIDEGTLGEGIAPAQEADETSGQGNAELPLKPATPDDVPSPPAHAVAADTENQETPPSEDASAGARTQKPAADPVDAPPVRFVWRTDADGKFSMVSPEFASAVGEPAADIIGRHFKDVATVFGFDPSGEIAGLLARRDTWSGRTVLWPVTGTDRAIPVDLAALPVYDRNRVFEGFRGFGVARGKDAMADPHAIGQALVRAPEPVQEPAPPATDTDPFKGEIPALTIVPQPERRFTDKVIRLAEHRPPANDKGLSSLERSAFREIGERLRKESEAKSQETATEKPAETVQPEESVQPAPMEIALHPADEASRPEIEPQATDPAPVQAQHGGETPAEDTPPPETVPVAEGSATAATVQESAPSFPRETVVPSAFALPSPADSGPDISVLGKLPVPLLFHSGDTLHFANEEFLRLTGYETLDDLAEAGGLGALFADPLSQDNAPESGTDRALRLKTQDGREFPIDALLRSVPWGAGKALVLLVQRSGDAEPEAAAVSAAPAASEPVLLAQPDIAELKARIAEMRTIIDTATDGVVLIDRDGMIRSISRPAEALFGFDSDEVAGKPFPSLFAIESQRAARDYLSGLSDNGVASVLNDGREVIGREAQGRFIPLFMTIGRLPNDSGFCAVVRDITQWKRAEEDLTQARAVAERAHAEGFAVMRVAAADAIPLAPDRLKAWLEAGYHGDMNWMDERTAERADPRALWSEVRSVVMLGMNYAGEGDPLAMLSQPDKGAISLYARRRDYHDVIKGKLKSVAGLLAARGGADVKVFVDTAPVMEKPLAQAAGLGWQGKHSVLVSREHGSWLLLGAIYTTAALPADAPAADHCGSCRRCLDICPTDAFPAPYQLDARRCIAYLTIEHPGHIDAALRRGIGNRIFGCDDCLAVCPWNKFARRTDEPDFRARNDLDTATLPQLFAWEEDEFLRRTEGSPIRRSGHERWLRNIAVALGNAAPSPAARQALESRLGHPSALVREHVAWVLQRHDQKRDPA